jgi:hypothetical protein
MKVVWLLKRNYFLAASSSLVILGLLAWCRHLSEGLLHLHHVLMLKQLAMDLQRFRLVLNNLKLLTHVVGIAFDAVSATVAMGITTVV